MCQNRPGQRPGLEFQIADMALDGVVGVVVVAVAEAVAYVKICFQCSMPKEGFLWVKMGSCLAHCKSWRWVGGQVQINTKHAKTVANFGAQLLPPRY